MQWIKNYSSSLIDDLFDANFSLLLFIFSELKSCFEFLNTDKSSRAIVLTGAGKCFTSGIDVKYLSSSAVSELGEIDDVARKAMHLRRMILRTQSSLRAVDKVTKIEKDL